MSSFSIRLSILTAPRLVVVFSDCDQRIDPRRFVRNGFFFDVAFATGLAALAPGCVTGWHGGGWFRLWSEEQESFIRKLCSAISVERSHG
jgi:hypothetical protein